MDNHIESQVLATIVHLSDLHFGTIYDQNLGKMLLSVIPPLAPDILVVSGDVGDSPRPRWFRVAARYLEAMRRECEKRSGRRPALIVVPGNHDRKLLGNLTLGALARMNFAVYFADWPGQLADPDWRARWGRYWALLGHGVRRFFQPWTKRVAETSAELTGRVLLGGKVVVVSYDSNDSWLLAAGRVRPDEIRRTELTLRTLQDQTESLDPAACRIAIVHHHPVTIPYADKKSLTNLEEFLVFENSGTFMREMVKNDFDLILHGHKHYSNFTRVRYQLSANEIGEVGVLAAGTATVKGGNQYGANSYNVIRVFDQGRVQLEIWEYGGAQGLHYALHTPYPFELFDAEGLKRRALRRHYRRHQIKANCLSVTHELHPDGRAEVTYAVEGLVATGRNLSGYQTRGSFDIGIMRGLDLDSATKMAGMTREEPGPAPQPATAEERLKALRRMDLTILFNRGLGRLDKPMDFGLSYSLVSGYAMSDWEFEVLYPPGRRTNEAGEPLQEPLESTFQVVWFPLDRLRMRVKLPSVITDAPYIDVFRNPSIVGQELVDGRGVLRCPPEKADRSERDAYMREAEEGRLRREQDNTWLLEIDNPMVGCRYVINWRLPRVSRRALPTALIAEAETFREILVRYRKSRLAKASVSDSKIAAVREVFGWLYQLFRRTLPSIDSEERFDVVLFTYDAKDPTQTPALVAVEGLVNGEELPEPYWDLRLPPGVGNAGTCFKRGEVCVYAAGEASEQFSYYVPLTGVDPHQLMVSVPLDHPKFSEEAQRLREPPNEPGVTQTAADWVHQCQAARKRQVVGVISVGSSSAASTLRQLVPGNGERGEGARKLAENLAAVCQVCLNRLWTILTSA